ALVSCMLLCMIIPLVQGVEGGGYSRSFHFSSPEFIFLSASGSNGIIVQSVRTADVDLLTNSL
ncbi:MAG: hypothetical protein E6Z15_28395, partial [Paenibacillus macerans]|nr:hypothetical protein [Paenibacillus macerans]